MTHLAYLVAGWGIALVVLGVYGFGLLRRGRRLTGQVPAGQGRWLTSPGDDGRGG